MDMAHMAQIMVMEHAKALHKRFGEGGREEKEYGDGDQTPLKGRGGFLLGALSRELFFNVAVCLLNKFVF
jgi:hypothetical protein